MKEAKIKEDCKFLNQNNHCTALKDTYCEYQETCAFYKKKAAED